MQNRIEQKIILTYTIYMYLVNTTSSNYMNIKQVGHTMSHKRSILVRKKNIEKKIILLNQFYLLLCFFIWGRYLLISFNLGFLLLIKLAKDTSIQNNFKLCVSTFENLILLHQLNIYASLKLFKVILNLFENM